MKVTRIRAITVGINFDQHNPINLQERLNKFYKMAEQLYHAAGFLVQTRRLTISPMNPTDITSCYQIKSIVDTLSRLSNQIGIRWFCLPIRNQTQWPTELIQVITNIISLYPKVFIHFMVTEQGNISSLFSSLAARTILVISRLSSNGYDNFRVGVGANIQSNTPYFPFSYHEGNTGFSLAVELIELLIQIVKKSGIVSLDVIRERLVEAISPVIQEIDTIGQNLERKTGFEYKGQDISLAPFPDEIHSIATLIEMLGPMHCGQSGTLMITSLLTDVLKTAIKQTKIRYVGFNGVMFSPLEDCQLAKANNQRHLSIEKLMMYAAVCGCGIDMVPVPGDLLEEELNNLILDIAALSTVLNKPLGVRILPIPLKGANELTNFNHDFLTNTRVMQVNGQKFALPFSSTTPFRYLRFERPPIREYHD